MNNIDLGWDSLEDYAFLLLKVMLLLNQCKEDIYTPIKVSYIGVVGAVRDSCAKVPHHPFSFP